MRSALVTCGEHRAALAIVRSLGRWGFDVTVASHNERSLAGASRHATDELRTPDPVASPRDFAAVLADVIEERRPDVVIPVTEAALLAGLPLAVRFPDAVFPFPDVERFSAVCDKTRVFDAARQEGISVPREVVLHTASDVASDRVELAFPVVIKPGRSVSGDSTGRRRHGVIHAADASALSAALRELPGDAFPVHVQQRIIGPGTGVFLLPWKGRMQASFAHRRLREKPPSGGVSVLCESIPLDPDLLERSTRLLARFDWDGVAMVEYKIDAATGEPFLMEINGRFWGSLQLAISSGVDFPRHLVAAALGESLEPAGDYRVGVRNRWVWGDVDHLLARLRRSPRRLALPPGAPGKVKTLAGFLSGFATARSEVFRLADPAPAWREARQWFADLGTSGTGE